MLHWPSRAAAAATLAVLLKLLLPTSCIAETRIPRDVIALFDSLDDAQPTATLVHQLLEMPLNHLGYRVVYRDVRAGLPQLAVGGPVRGVVLWLRSSSKPPAELWRWLAGLERDGVRHVIVANGALLQPGRAGERSESRLPAPLRYTGYHVERTFDAVVAALDPAMFGIEGGFAAPYPGFPAVELLGASTPADPVAVHLAIEYALGPRRQRAVIAATGRFGGYIAEDYAFTFDRTSRRLRWIVDPFRFLEAALGSGRPWPIPDTTTLTGRRIYFSHVDGDGWGNPTSVPGYVEREAIAAEVLHKELVEPFPDLPVTIGLVAGDLDPQMGGSRQARRSAQDVLSLRHVEAGCHTYTHPYDWAFFGSYSRSEELRRTAAARAAGGSLDNSSGITAQARQRTFLPRLYGQVPFDREREVAGAVALIESLLPRGKRVALYQWSGSTLPDEDMVRRTRAAGLANMNGGDPRLDRQFPSHAYLSPLTRPVGAERQVYTAGSNEFIYWQTSGSAAGYLLFSETVERSEQPRRLKPFNLYFHAYSAERSETLAIVRRHIELARRSPVHPIASSRFASIVEGFFAAEIDAISDDVWVIGGRGMLGTFRLDGAGGRRIDFDRSRGILGERETNGSLYVSLDEAEPRPVIALLRENSPSTATRPRLVESNWRISRLSFGHCQLRFDATGFGTGRMLWDGLPPGAYVITTTSGVDAKEWQLDADGAGRLDLSLPSYATDNVTIAIRCRT